MRACGPRCCARLAGTGMAPAIPHERKQRHFADDRQCRSGRCKATDRRIFDEGARAFCSDPEQPGGRGSGSDDRRARQFWEALQTTWPTCPRTVSRPSGAGGSRMPGCLRPTSGFSRPRWMAGGHRCWPVGLPHRPSSNERCEYRATPARPDARVASALVRLPVRLLTSGVLYNKES